MNSIGLQVRQNGEVFEHCNGRFKFLMLVTFLTSSMNNYTAQLSLATVIKPRKNSPLEIK
jgi:hypothetical protein